MLTSTIRQIDGVGTSSAQALILTQFARETRDLLQNGSGRNGLNVFVQFAHGDRGPTAWSSTTKHERQQTTDICHKK
ncbi:hypothetical protein BKA67DRAFT_549979 [Truncatella angustata]|uniref:Uncharacterized protein n=1 Tax=Truncatella angustata TaxID=152316 RepID=A0A9P8UZI8_9PEZI|nr:uncharacterized protein BKA67DRAFT_549979 [Truncatella angustata]KAH6661043.1 hypothetical protein BKA67DRAFT_549979 [Truncatella angustata]